MAGDQGSGTIAPLLRLLRAEVIRSQEPCGYAELHISVNNEELVGVIRRADADRAAALMNAAEDLLAACELALEHEQWMLSNPHLEKLLSEAIAKARPAVQNAPADAIGGRDQH
jgi:hypothetical protein